MLHVTNGDCAADVIREAGLPGEVLPWRDVLHEGPVPARLPLEELSAVRARWMDGHGWVAPEVSVAGEFAARDRTLAGFRDHDEVVLWFEHDLYDQLQLVQLLDWFATQDLGTTRLTLVCGDEYLGLSTPARLAERFAGRRPVTDAQLALGEAAWNAFRSPDPTAVSSLLAEDTSALPWLDGALRRHLEQFPSTRNGLSRSEQQALEALADGARTLRDVFLAHNHREDPVWLGDAPLVDYVEDLARGDAPLVRIGRNGDGLLDRGVELTDAGWAVLDEREDRVRLNGIDRWLGGVHLRGHESPWRWDPGERRLVSTSA
ncbi:MAG TPA: DUF1835 domain-containing protein [Longimicrobium sp.]|jgi:hypothetical protein